MLMHMEGCHEKSTVFPFWKHNTVCYLIVINLVNLVWLCVLKDAAKTAKAALYLREGVSKMSVKIPPLHNYGKYSRSKLIKKVILYNVMDVYNRHFG